MENLFWRKLGLAVFILVAIFGFPIFTHAASSVEGKLEGSISGEALTILINKERLKNNMPILEQDDTLQKAAELKAKDMLARGYFSHNTPDGKLPWYWLNKVGYGYELAGENLAMNFFESSKAVKAWVNSPKHRQNLLNEKYTEVGIAVTEGVYKGKATTFVVQFLGKPHRISFVDKISNELKTIISSIL